MFTKNELEKFLNILVSTGADFAEVYVETSKNCNYCLLDSKLDDIVTSANRGIGLRIVKDLKTTYASIANPILEEVIRVCHKLARTLTGKGKDKVVLKEITHKSIIPVKIPFDDYPIQKKISLLKEIDEVARKESSLIYQVEAKLIEKSKDIVIANSNGLLTTNRVNNLRILCGCNAKKEGKLTRDYKRYDKSMGYEILEEVNIEDLAKSAAKSAVEKLDATYIKGGRMPAIIGNGFGALLIHEACGHGLEATSVAPGYSVFSSLQGQKVANEKVTLIDDSTIKNGWGSYTVDDEGNPSEKRVLIEKGILKDYLVDYINGIKMKHPGNGCGRRQSYQYAPTSRMSNTYLENGKDSIDDMIKSIDYGIYATNFDSGSVDPLTGDFNFSVDNARLIENGHLTKRVEAVSLIGSSKELLENIEMVSDDLKLEGGYCGSDSGIVPVTAGQPTVKVSSILVGGMEND